MNTLMPPGCDKCGGLVVRVAEDELQCLLCATRVWRAWPVEDLAALRAMKGRPEGARGSG